MNIRHCVAIVALTACFSAEATDTVMLKKEAFVQGPKVYLSDVAEVTGDNAETLGAVEIANAPTPGKSCQFDASYITARVKMANVDTSKVQWSGANAVKATTIHLEVTNDMLADDLRQFIETQMPWNPMDTTIDVEVPVQTLVVPDGNVEFTWRPNPQYGFLGPGAFRGEVRVDGQLKKTVVCRANVEAFGEVVVATRDIARGRVIGLNDVALEKRPLTSAQQGALWEPGEVLGAVAKNPIYAGQVVTLRSVVPPTIIKRGQTVNVEVRSGGLLVRAQARAKTDAREGDILVCISPESKEEIQGMVQKDGTVIID